MDAKPDLALSVVVTVVNGGECLRRCLEALDRQIDAASAEIIVPYDGQERAPADLAAIFPRVRFHRVDDLGAGVVDSRTSRAHRVIDRCRAVGLALSTGRIVAMVEDRGVPAPDWCRQVMAVHEQPRAVVGGAIVNGVDRAMNWALYYCDFGRYGLPLAGGAAEFVSDTNVAYERGALESVRDAWRERYQETTVHWALRARGRTLWLDPRLVTTQLRGRIALGEAYRERIDNARLFAETRVAAVPGWRRALFMAGTPLLPFVLLFRVARQMLRQRRSPRQVAATLPLAALLLTGTALGELLGYLEGPPYASVEPGGGVKREAMKS